MLRIVLPLEETPTILCDESMLHLPSLKIDGHPSALAVRPARPDALKGVPNGKQRLVRTLQTLIILEYFLRRGSVLKLSRATESERLP